MTVTTAPTAQEVLSAFTQHLAALARLKWSLADEDNDAVTALLQEGVLVRDRLARNLAEPQKLWLGDEEGLSVAGLIATLQSLPYGKHGQEATVFVGSEPVRGVTTSFHRVRDIADMQVYLCGDEEHPAHECDLPFYSAVITGEEKP